MGEITKWQSSGKENYKSTAIEKITLAFRAFEGGLRKGETARRLQWPKSKRRLALRNCKKEKREEKKKNFYSV